MEMEKITIDGATGEGGGQVIRTSVSLAALTGKTVEIVNVRVNRSKPGLQAQHLTAARAAAALCDAELKGAELNSQYLRFTPRSLTDHSAFSFDVAEARNGASAGATGLVAQTLLVPMAFLPGSPATASILGGTHVPMAPPADYIENVYAPLLNRMGVSARVTLDRAGFFPRGGGGISLRVSGAFHAPLDLAERGKLKRLRLFLVTSQLPSSVAERGRDALAKELKGYGVPILPEIRERDGAGAGAAIVLVAECENGIGGFTALGERGKPMERVALEALREFQKWFATSAGVDEHLADQLALPCALVPAESRWTTPTTTEHLRTVLSLIQRFLPIDYRIETQENRPSIVTMRGVSLS